MQPASSQELARSSVLGTLWTYGSYYSGKLLVFVSTIILARLLLREDFGVAGYALVVISFLDVLSDLGIGPALVYHPADQRAADTAFWLGLAIALSLCGLTWLLAPLVGLFFQDPRAIPVTRVLALTFPLAALGNVHDALLRKGLAFRRKFVPDVAKAAGKGGMAIGLALLGFGYWSLIIGQLGGTALAALVYWWVVPWRPRLRFAPRIARSLVRYGLGIVSINGLSILLLNVDYLLVGRFLGAAALGVYTLAFRIPELIVMQFCHVVAQVLFPVYTRLRDDPQALRNGFLATTRYVALVTVPLGLGLALTAQPFVLTVLSDRWAEAIPVLRAIALYALLLSLAYNAGDVYKAQGRPGVLTRLALLKAAMLVPALWWAISGPGTITAVGWTQAAIALVSGALNLGLAARMLQLRMALVLDALRPALLGGALMALVVQATLLLLASAPAAVQLAAASILGALSYAGTLWWLQRDVVRLAGKTLRMAVSQR